MKLACVLLVAAIVVFNGAVRAATDQTTTGTTDTTTSTTDTNTGTNDTTTGSTDTNTGTADTTSGTTGADKNGETTLPGSAAENATTAPPCVPGSTTVTLKEGKGGSAGSTESTTMYPCDSTPIQG